MTNLTSAEQAHKWLDRSTRQIESGTFLTLDNELRILAKDYIAVLAERDRLEAELTNSQRDLAAGVEQGKAAIEAYRVAVNAPADWWERLNKLSERAGGSPGDAHLNTIERLIEAYRVEKARAGALFEVLKDIQRASCGEDQIAEDDTAGMAWIFRKSSQAIDAAMKDHQ